MKIGISCWPTFGGSGVVASELGMGLAERGHEVHFITYAVPGRLNVYQPGIYYHEVTVPEYPLFEYPQYSLALASKMAECATREGLDIIHAHYAIPHAASALMAKDMVNNNDLKVITTLHGTDITLVGSDPSFMPVTRHAILRSDAVSAVSIFLRDEICRIFTCDRDVNVIYNFVNPVDFEKIDQEHLKSNFAPNGEKLLVHVSNFRPVKRVRDVIDVFLRVRKKVKTRLILIGSGPDLPAAEVMAREAGADRDLIVLGNRETVNEIIATADILLLPSETESFGLAALEAMACGVPPVVSNVGGLPEVVENGVTGILVEVGDCETMADYVLDLFADEEKRSQMGEAAKRTAFGKFSINTALDTYEDLYRRVLSG